VFWGHSVLKCSGGIVCYSALTPPLFIHVIGFARATAVSPWVLKPIIIRQSHLGLVGCSYATFVPMGVFSEVQPFWCIACLLVLAAAVQQLIGYYSLHSLLCCSFTLR